MTVNELLNNVCCASLPAKSLGALAAVRDLSGVEVALLGDRAWLRWEAGEANVLRAVLPIRGVELFVTRDGHWYRFGRHLPAFDFPKDADYRPLCQILTPAPVCPVSPPPLAASPAALTLVADSRPRPAAALRCNADDLARWADGVPEGRLAALQGAQCGARLLVIGARLPALTKGERFWGTSVLAPLGRRPEPDLPPDALREALGVAVDELLLLDDAGAEVIPTAALGPLTRAAVRLASKEAVP